MVEKMKHGTVESYAVFVRDWWRRPERGEPTSYENKVPYPGAPRKYIARDCTQDEARDMAQEYNATHEHGWTSRKAEFESE